MLTLGAESMTAEYFAWARGYFWLAMGLGVCYLITKKDVVFLMFEGIMILSFVFRYIGRLCLYVFTGEV